MSASIIRKLGEGIGVSQYLLWSLFKLNPKLRAHHGQTTRELHIRKGNYAHFVPVNLGYVRVK